MSLSRNISSTFLCLIFSCYLSLQHLALEGHFLLAVHLGAAGTGIRGQCLGMNPGQQEAAALAPHPCHLSPSEGSRQPGCGLPNEDREVVLAVHRCRFPINRGDIPKHCSLQSRHWTGLGHILMAAGPASVCLKSHCPREPAREPERSTMSVKPTGASLFWEQLILATPDIKSQVILSTACRPKGPQLQVYTNTLISS